MYLELISERQTSNPNVNQLDDVSDGFNVAAKSIHFSHKKSCTSLFAQFDGCFQCRALGE